MSILTTPRAPTCWACDRVLENPDLITCRTCRVELTIRHKLNDWRGVKAMTAAGVDFHLADVRLSAVPALFRRTA